jgi:uncharacterized membrane protein YkvA (DUF1232 family)
MVTPEFPHLQLQLKLLGSFFADCADGLFQSAPTATRKEAGFALRYADQKTDIIPDGVAGIGYADDSLIVRTVLNRHQEVFSEYCLFEKFPGREFLLGLKKNARQPGPCEDDGAFLPIARSYFKV